MGNTFGHLFRITTYGESHGRAVGVVIDGCPPHLPMTVAEIQAELDRRRPGQSPVASPRKEKDSVAILSGIFEEKTLGTPISLIVYNEDSQSSDYDHLKNLYRPGHADYTYQMKYGHRDWRGSGRSSARETVGRVAAGAIAKKLLKFHTQTEIIAFVEQVGPVKAQVDNNLVRREQVEENDLRCPESGAAERMNAHIDAVRASGDTIGGVIGCVARNVPVGLGEPVFDKLEADLAKAMLSIPATKGFEIGSGFRGAEMTGSQHNDLLYMEDDKVRFRSNHAGGTLGGISSGQDIIIRIAFKPVSTHFREQETVTMTGESVTLKAHGRHDACVLPRAVPIVEAMTALVLADHWLRQRKNI